LAGRKPALPANEKRAPIQGDRHPFNVSYDDPLQKRLRDGPPRLFIALTAVKLKAKNASMNGDANILITDVAWPDIDLEREILAEAQARPILAENSDADTLARLAAEHAVAGILTCWAQVPAAVIDASPHVRIVSRLGIGLDNIDVSHCTRRGIPVTNVPDYCQTEVVEHTLALLFALGRKVAFYHHQTKQQHYDRQAGPSLHRMAGQTLGIVGLGAIGRKLAAHASALGLRIVATSRRPVDPPEGVTLCSLDELLAECDYVSLHVPLTEATRGMIGREQLARMKPTAYLINTARGGVVDHAALAAALEAGQLAGAALDVQEPEPPDLSQPPYNDPRVIVTPHAAFASVESVAELRTRAARQVVDRLQGKTPEHVVNPEVL
jgi:D-3-phosphoglycerate dehydrogenase